MLVKLAAIFFSMILVNNYVLVKFRHRPDRLNIQFRHSA